mmetsp:Transcript_8571/g.25692  ORF Transcript_8571/g.25692 Transcript_8571/m.25692 type:complete len:316 (+) Transcript_8571:205-1152(+)
MADQAANAKGTAADVLSSLKEKATEVKAAVTDKLPSVSTTGGDGPADTELYDTLGVDENASKREIKAAYKEVSKQDLTPEEREHAKEAVDVLSNKNKREQYDSIGYAGIHEQQLVSAAQAVGLAIAGDYFEEYVGQVAMASAAGIVVAQEYAGPESLQDPRPIKERLQTLQQERVNMLAEKLKGMLQPYVDGDRAGFRMKMNEEAQRLANHAFGAPLLHVLGYEYDRKAEPWLGNVIGEFFVRKYHNAATLANAAKAYVSFKLMKRDLDTNGANGGPMNPLEAAGAFLVSFHPGPLLVMGLLTCWQVIAAGWGAQ